MNQIAADGKMRRIYINGLEYGSDGTSLVTFVLTAKNPAKTSTLPNTVIQLTDSTGHTTTLLKGSRVIRVVQGFYTLDIHGEAGDLSEIANLMNDCTITRELEVQSIIPGGIEDNLDPNSCTAKALIMIREKLISIHGKIPLTVVELNPANPYLSTFIIDLSSISSTGELERLRRVWIGNISINGWTPPVGANATNVKISFFWKTVVHPQRGYLVRANDNGSPVNDVRADWLYVSQDVVNNGLIQSPHQYQYYVLVPAIMAGGITSSTSELRNLMRNMADSLGIIGQIDQMSCTAPRI